MEWVCWARWMQKWKTGLIRSVEGCRDGFGMIVWMDGWMDVGDLGYT